MYNKENLVEIQNKVIGYFDTHPTVDEFHFTSDGMAFIIKDDAEAHGATLEYSEVASLHRKNLKAAIEQSNKAIADLEAETVIDPVAVITESVKDPATDQAHAASIMGTQAVSDIKERAETEKLPVKAAAKKAAAKK